MSIIAGVEYQLIDVADLALLRARDVEHRKIIQDMITEIGKADDDRDAATDHVRALLLIVAKHVSYSTAPEQAAVIAAQQFVEGQP